MLDPIRYRLALLQVRDMNDVAPLPMAAGAGGAVWLLAQASSLSGDVTPLAILSGVLATLAALLGWIVRRQQAAYEAQAAADRSEREKDRQHDREERERMLSAFREELAAERDLSRTTVAQLVHSLESGRHCKAGP